MATNMQTLVGVSEEDDEEEMDMDVKEEDEEDEENEEKQIAALMMMGVEGVMPSTSDSDHFQYQPQLQEQVSNPGGGGARRSRPLEEKERTKLRECHQRAITARILAGLRRHGNYNLRVRADINDVIAALAKEAGWVVLPDGPLFHQDLRVQHLLLALLLA